MRITTFIVGILIGCSVPSVSQSCAQDQVTVEPAAAANWRIEGNATVAEHSLVRLQVLGGAVTPRVLWSLQPDASKYLDGRILVFTGQPGNYAVVATVLAANGKTTTLNYAVRIAAEFIPTPAPTPQGDPSGFTQLLNVARVARSLTTLVYEPAMADIAVANNAAQRIDGIGHYVTGGFAQVAAKGFLDVPSVIAGWTNSPGHAAILYNRNVTSVGYANDGLYATATFRGWSYGQQVTIVTLLNPSPRPLQLKMQSAGFGFRWGCR